DEYNAALHPASSRIIVFGSNAATLPDTAALRRLAPIDSAGQVVDRSGSDLEGALNAARGQIAPDSTPRVVLFSDGHQTGGSVENAIARFRAAHIPVFVEPMAVRSLGDAWIDRIDFPERITAGATFTTTITVGAQRGTPGTLTLRADDAVVATREITLPVGLTPIAVEGRIDTPGNHVIRGSLSVSGDPLAANNTLESVAEVLPRTRMLYV